MDVLIVEDERPAAARLRQALNEYSERIHVVEHLQTVSDAVAWFNAHEAPDLVFLDVRLSDGLSLEIFRRADVACPVIFTTAYDAYVLDAFECNSIDYLLKPIKPDRLAQALQKYEKLRRHFTADVADVVDAALTRKPAEYRSRLVVQKGTSYVALEVRDVRYAYSDQRTTFVVDASGQRYITDDAVTILEELVDPAAFFRLNRKYLARVDAIESFRPASRGRLQIHLDPPPGECILVSQEKAARFKAWISR